MWAGAVTIHSLKDGFYRPTARTTGFTYPNYLYKDTVLKLNFGVGCFPSLASSSGYLRTGKKPYQPD
jgi:hypothetical protein